MKTPILALLFVAISGGLLAQLANDQASNTPAPTQPPGASNEIRYSDKVPVLGDLPVVGRLFRSEGTISPYTANVPGWSAGPAQSTQTILSFHQTDPKSIDEMAEDLNIFSYILRRNLERVLGAERPDYKLGVPILLNADGRSVEASYLEGYGGVFRLSVRFPLVAPSTPQAKTEPPSSNLEWDQAREALRGGLPDGNVTWYQMPETAGEHYDPRLVEILKNQIIETLHNGTNLRLVKSNEWIAVVVSGNLNARVGYRKPSNDGSVSIVRLLDSGRATLMAVRVKKSAADALAAKKISEEQFGREVEATAYLGEAMTRARAATASRWDRLQNAGGFGEAAIAGRPPRPDRAGAGTKTLSAEARQACVANLKLIDGAKEEWAVANHKTVGTEVKMSDLVPGYLKSEPKCPLGGAYIVNPVGTDPVCPNYNRADPELRRHTRGGTQF